MFTLAHLSDPHLAPLPTPHWKELISKRVTGYVNWQKKRRFVHDAEALAAIVSDIKAQAPDHIAVTGDIANIALAAEFRQGRDWLENLASAQDVSLVPGNHDIYVGEAAAFAARQWGSYMSDDEGVEGFPYLRRRGNVVLVGLSSGVPTAPFLATGWLGAKQLTDLAAMLNQLSSENLFRVVLILRRGTAAQTVLDARLKRVIATEWLLRRPTIFIWSIGWKDRTARACLPSVCPRHRPNPARTRMPPPTISTASTVGPAPGTANSYRVASPPPARLRNKSASCCWARGVGCSARRARTIWPRRRPART
jgi:3',5'-cyclic AMP phosphodiesterase CpdA